ncbi:MAG: hypothetical protein KDK39_04310 [Leptospiraceae bacterium]|nr:hypothetical protein [Leptospiraceae bacterium]
MKTRVFFHGLMYLICLVVFLVLPYDEHFIQFAGDQQWLISTAEQISHGKLIVMGHPSIHGPNHPGPLYLYFITIIYNICFQSIPATSLLLSAIKLSLLLYGLVNIFIIMGLNYKTAWIPAMLFMFQPLSSNYVSIIWAPAFSSFLLPFIYLTWFNFVHKKQLHYFRLLIILISVQVQTHYSQTGGMLVLGISAAYVYLRSGKISLKLFMAHVLLATILWLPVLFDLINRGSNSNPYLLVKFVLGHKSVQDVQSVFAAYESLLASLLPFMDTRHAISGLIITLIALPIVFLKTKSKRHRILAFLVVGQIIINFISISRSPVRIQFYFIYFNTIPLFLLIIYALNLVIIMLLSKIKNSLSRAFVCSCPSKLNPSSLALVAFVIALIPLSQFYKLTLVNQWNRYHSYSALLHLGNLIETHSHAKPVFFQSRSAELEGRVAAILYIFQKKNIQFDYNSINAYYFYSNNQSASKCRCELIGEMDNIFVYYQKRL